METGLSLFAQSHLPKTFWVETFNTAIYLINRLPTTVLDYRSPFQVLLNETPDYSFLRTFGCACYPCLITIHKLLFHSKRCIFLWYCANHRGYRCLDPSTNRVYLIWHVVCDELQFPDWRESLNLLKSAATDSDQVRQNPCNSNSTNQVITSLISLNYNFTTCRYLTHRPYSYLTPVVTALQPLLNHQINPQQIPPYHQTPHWTHLLHLTMITLWLLSKSGIHCPKTFPDYQVYYSTKHPIVCIAYSCNNYWTLFLHSSCQV